MAELDLATSELPNDAELMANIALVQLRQGKFDEAVQIFRRPPKLDPLESRPSFELALPILPDSMRRFTDAEQSVNRAIALDPKRGWTSIPEKLR